MKNTFRFLYKLAISGIISLVILSCFCLIYDNPPYAVEQTDNFTNYKFESNSFWSSMTEGFAFGKTNNIGYNDLHDIAYSEPVIAFLGSSQTEAFQVMQNKNFVSLTQHKLFDDDNLQNDLKCVNLGISSHYFNVCVSNLKAFADKFENAQYVIIEARSLRYTEDELGKMLNDEYHEAYKEKGTLYSLIRKVPYLRTLKKQYEKAQKKDESGTQPFYIDYSAYEEKLNDVMIKLSSIAEEKGFKIIILYHNSVKVDETNNVYREDDAELHEIFSRCCEQNGISFLDVTDKFISHYQNTYEMPYGFSNTYFGSGHLNEVGHSIIADQIYDQICELSRGE